MHTELRYRGAYIKTIHPKLQYVVTPGSVNPCKKVTLFGGHHLGAFISFLGSLIRPNMDVNPKGIPCDISTIDKYLKAHIPGT